MSYFQSDKPTPPIINEEIATSADGMDITYPFMGELIVNKDRILQAKGSGDVEIYEHLITDDRVRSGISQRQDALIACETEVVAGDSSVQAVKAADFIRETLANLQWDEITKKAWWAVYYGYGVAECIWTRDGSYTTLAALKVKNRRRFNFGKDGLRLRTLFDPLGMPLPPRKFWEFATGADNDDAPYGLGLAHYLYWLVFFKRGGLKSWSFWLERNADPPREGEYPVGTQEADQQKLLRALRNLGRDSAMIRPIGTMVRFLETSRSSTPDYVALYDAMNAAISEVLLGQAMTTDQKGGQFKADSAKDIRDEIIKGDADLICGSFNDQVVRWLCDWNFPGVKPPKVWRRTEKPPDVKSLADKDKLLFDMGYRLLPEKVAEIYGDGYEQVAPAPVNTQLVPDISPQPQFAEAKPDTIDLFTNRLRQKAGKVTQGWISQIETLLDDCQDLAEFSERIAEIYPELNPDKMTEIMREGIVAARLAGMYEAQINK